MNSSTIFALGAGTIQNAIASLALATSTTETAFSVNGNALAGIAAKPAIISVPAGYATSGRPFRIRAWGTCTTGTSANLTLKLYEVSGAIVAAGSGGTLSNDSAVAASSARAVNSITAPFEFIADFQYDAVGKILKGRFTTELSNVIDAYAASTAVATLVEADLNFVLSATLSSGNAANKVDLKEFSIESM